MKVLIRHLLKKTRTGGYAQRDETIESPSIRFGRGSECEVHLTDPRILLLQLEITQRSGKLHLTSQGDSDFQVNGQISTKASVKPGDKIQLGPYDIEILDSEEGFDAVITLTNEDKLYLTDLGCETNIHVIPPQINIPDIDKISKIPNSICFVGSFNREPNTIQLKPTKTQTLIKMESTTFKTKIKILIIQFLIYYFLFV